MLAHFITVVAHTADLPAPLASPAPHGALAPGGSDLPVATEAQLAGLGDVGPGQMSAALWGHRGATAPKLLPAAQLAVLGTRATGTAAGCPLAGLPVWWARGAMAGFLGGWGPGTHGTAAFIQFLSRFTRNAEEDGAPNTFAARCRALRVSHPFPVSGWRPQVCPGMGRGRHLGDPHLPLEGTRGPGRPGCRSGWGLHPENLCAGRVV